MGYMKRQEYNRIIRQQVITIDEVVERYGIGSETIGRWIKSGCLISVMIDGREYLSNEFLDETIQDLLADVPPMKSLLHRIRSKMPRQAEVA